MVDDVKQESALHRSIVNKVRMNGKLSQLLRCCSVDLIECARPFKYSNLQQNHQFTQNSSSNLESEPQLLHYDNFHKEYRTK